MILGSWKVSCSKSSLNFLKAQYCNSMQIMDFFASALKMIISKSYIPHFETWGDAIHEKRTNIDYKTW